MDLFLYGFFSWIDEGGRVSGSPPNAAETSFGALGFLNSANGLPGSGPVAGRSCRGTAEGDSEVSGGAARRAYDFAKNSPGA